jgi:U3 small nucleolar RNA-associated protein 22
MIHRVAGEQKSKEKDKRDTVVLNRQSVLDEIERLNTGLIQKLTVLER